MKEKINKTIRLKDVAERAGVGVGTASRVLNNHPSVSQQKRRKVLKVMEEMGYRPNAIARSLKTNYTKTIGIIIMDITNPFYSNLLKGLQDFACKNDYSIILADLAWNANKLLSTIKTMQDKKVDGFIYLGSHVKDKEIRWFTERQKPVVFISTAVLITDQSLRNKFIDIGINNEQASYDAVKYLINLGHKDIAIISGIKGDMNSSVPRMKGYQRAMKEAGVAINEEWIAYGKHTFKSGYQAMLKFINKKKRPTGVFAICDLMAIGAAKAALDYGLRIPEDMTIMGFDGIDNAEYFNPSISTIVQPRYEMGQKGMELMLRMVEGEINHGYEVILDYRLVERESSRSI
ncbi:transcriptional regulator, LacI family [Natronincola peptidivorans]|uniref:Transcriptional regulator, LacI family n=1 Tax=Natronincola peptidivorans TaxID=426128 RepID=A0A1I0A577_9FIRM|nr:substrate-binding domain-containing protein [Natronincola peptidivorans]SES89257.1 transcriptional regulator, LacI family [Natronincola peptidivorans]